MILTESSCVTLLLHSISGITDCIATFKKMQKKLSFNLLQTVKYTTLLGTVEHSNYIVKACSGITKSFLIHL